MKLRRIFLLYSSLFSKLIKRHILLHGLSVGSFSFQFLIILFAGCNTLSSGNPLPTECNVCRVAKDKNTGSCLPECPPEKFLTADKLCVDLSCK